MFPSVCVNNLSTSCVKLVGHEVLTFVCVIDFYKDVLIVDRSGKDESIDQSNKTIKEKFMAMGR